MDKYTHPHFKAIKKMNVSKLIEIIEHSKEGYVRENLKYPIHIREIKLLKHIRKSNKKHHLKIITKKYELMFEKGLTPMQELHIELHRKRLEKLEKKGYITVNHNPDCALPYYNTITEKGYAVLDAIEKLELEWENIVLKGNTMENELIEPLREVAINSLEITNDIRNKKTGELLKKD